MQHVFSDPLPVPSLLREDANVAELRQAQFKTQCSVLDYPAVRHINPSFPLTALSATSLCGMIFWEESCSCVLPSRLVPLASIGHRGRGAIKHERTETLQLAAFAEVE